MARARIPKIETVDPFPMAETSRSSTMREAIHIPADRAQPWSSWHTASTLCPSGPMTKAA